MKQSELTGNRKKQWVNNYYDNKLETRTYEDFYKFLGTRPERLGIVSRMYPELTAGYLTEALRNVFYRDLKKADKFQSIDSMTYEWEVNFQPIFLVTRKVVRGKNGEKWNS